MPFSTKVEIDEDLQDALRDIVSDFDKEDDTLHKAQVRMWKKCEEYWHGLQMIFWSEQDQSWISPDSVHFSDVFSEDEIANLGPIYDYVVDIYKAHGESIVAALASSVPSLRYRPDDADDESDRLTAQTYSKIADVIYIHNKAKLLFLRALYYLYNGGLVFSYRYTESNPEFGMVEIPSYGTTSEATCLQCGSVRAANEVMCSQCDSAETPAVQSKTVQTGTKSIPRTRLKIDIFGPLHVKVSYYATKQAACGYLILKTDQNKALIKSIFSDIEDKIEGERLESQDRFARSSYSFPHDVVDTEMDLVTVEKAWLRPWTFFKIVDKDKRKALLSKFPQGCQITFIGKNRVFAEAFDESLDTRWDIGQAGLSTFIHTDPIGKTIMCLQDMRNELVNLTMDTIDHGIPAVYADPATLSFDDYGKFESQPGCVYSAKAKEGQALGNSFYQEPKSMMSKEHMLFFRQIDQDAQFASGDFPAIHGGPSEGKSRTLGEYAMSKQMALQRLSILWEFTLDWWIRTIDGGVRLYADTVIADQQYSRKEDNNYVNVWIRRSEMEGKVGGVEAESGGDFPVSVVQKRDTFFKLMELNNPQINAALYTPANAKILKTTLAIEELDIPGEDQRVKQAREINDLIRPGVEPVPDGMGGFVPTVGVDTDVDDHAVHIATLKSFLVGNVGLDLKETNPAGYVNCIAHLRAHQQALIQQTQGAFERSAPGEAPDSGAQTTEGE